MSYPNDLKYTQDHEWIRMKDNMGQIGITSFAQEQLGDVVFVDLPEVGQSIAKGETFGAVESVKTVSDLYSPVDGVVKKVNESLADTPELVNQSPFEGGWMIEIEVSNPEQVQALLDADQYSKEVDTQNA